MVLVRDATSADAGPCAAIYAPYVTDTAISFELEAPGEVETASRIAAAQSHSAWLVAEADREVIGFAYGGPFRPRPAYAWAAETTVYLREGIRRSGAGRALMVELLARLTDLGYRRAIAVVALPNAASIGLHEALGYRRAALLERVGWKLGAWWDVAWLQRDLQQDEQDPPPPLH